MKNIFLIIITATLLNAQIVMGIVPQQSPLKLLKVWTPIAGYLSDATGEKIVFKTEKSIDVFEKVLYEGGYDFAYMNPYHFVVANKLKNYEAKVRAVKNIKGIMVKKKSFEKKNFINKNSKFLFPSPNAFAATLLIKYDLVNKFNVRLEDLNKAIYVNSHDSVYKGISRGIGDIGGGIERTFYSLSDKNTKEELEIIYTTDEYPSHPFAFKSEMPTETKDKLVKALLSMPKSYLKPLKMKMLKPIDNSEYDSVKKLAKKLEILPK